jgi:uncharacterized protein (UPF0332 family)
MSGTENLLAKAGRSFEAARELLRSGHADFAVSRAYYGCFYTAEALLLSKGLSYSRHAQVIAQCGRHFARTRELSVRHHRNMISAFNLRQVADYPADPEGIEPEDAQEVVSEGEGLLSAARSYLAQ